MSDRHATSGGPTIPFFKMQGAGNDYVYVDALQNDFPLELGSECARRWSDRHFGIGADGLIVMAPSSSCAVRMVMWNADGSRGAMCGNGLRCLALLAQRQGHVREVAFEVETDAGPRAVELLGGDLVRTAMGDVRVLTERELDVCGQHVSYHAGDAGNPHAVVFVDDVDSAPVETVGAAMQEHPNFPGGVNVEFVAVTGPDRLDQRTFERGSGETLACGTGAAVAAKAALVSGRVSAHEIAVSLRGGVLRVLLDGPVPRIEGPARMVYRGDIPLPPSATK